jgi:hypothetical protein
MGVMCEACRRVHFIATSRRVQLSQTAEGIYLLRCNPPCPAVSEFRKDGMHPYRVSEDVFKRGYANEGEYELVQRG